MIKLVQETFLEPQLVRQVLSLPGPCSIELLQVYIFEIALGFHLAIGVWE
jgi:hypothetical protein